MKLNKTQKILRWALRKREKSLAHIAKELNVKVEYVRAILNRTKRHGLITYSIIKSGRGHVVKLNLTQEAYYNRAVLIV